MSIFTSGRINVLDVSCDISGRYAARLLGRHGFNVTRAELRHSAAVPSLVQDGPAGRAGSPFFRYLDQARRHVEIDLAGPDGSDHLTELLARHDFVLSTFSPRSAAVLGLDMASLAKVEGGGPSLLSLTPYGLTAPDLDGTPTEKTLFARAGAMLVSGPPDGIPFCPNIPLASLLGGLYGAIAVVLGACQDTEDPLEIDIALVDVLAANLESVFSFYAYLEAVPYRGAGRGRLEQTAGSGVFHASDGLFYVFAGYHWLDGALTMLGRHDLLAEIKAADPQRRRALSPMIDEAVREGIASLTVAELSRRSQALSLPSGPANTVQSLFQDQQLAARRTLRVVEGGAIEIAEPFQISRGGQPSPPGDQVVQKQPRGALPLDGVLILDLTHAVAGPTATRILAEAGAEVIKVESVNRIDMARGMIPFGNEPGTRWWERSGYYADRNLGKRSITLDMATQEGRRLFLELVSRVDAVAVNFTPRVLRDWNLAPETMLEVNPRLTILLMSGFGQTGPRAESPALAGTMEAASGFSASMRSDDADRPGNLGFNFGDVISGVYGACALLLGLAKSGREGVGQVVDLACAEAPLAFLAAQILEYHVTGNEPSCSWDPFHAGRHILIEADEQRPTHQCWVLAYVPEEAAGTFETPEWQANQSLRARTEGQLAGSYVSTASRPELIADLAKAGIHAEPLLDAEDLWFDPHLRLRDFFVFAQARPLPTLPYPRALPILWDGRPLGPSMRSIPLLGDANWDVLGGRLGLSAATYAKLQSEGRIGFEPTSRLPKSYELPLDLEGLERQNLIRTVPGARQRVIASFTDEAAPPGRPSPGDDA